MLHFLSPWLRYLFVDTASHRYLFETTTRCVNVAYSQDGIRINNGLYHIDLQGRLHTAVTDASVAENIKRRRDLCGIVAVANTARPLVLTTEGNVYCVWSGELLYCDVATMRANDFILLTGRDGHRYARVEPALTRVTPEEAVTPTPALESWAYVLTGRAYLMWIDSLLSSHVYCDVTHVNNHRLALCSGNDYIHCSQDENYIVFYRDNGNATIVERNWYYHYPLNDNQPRALAPQIPTYECCCSARIVSIQSLPLQGRRPIPYVALLADGHVYYSGTGQEHWYGVAAVELCVHSEVTPVEVSVLCADGRVAMALFV